MSEYSSDAGETVDATPPAPSPGAVTESKKRVRTPRTDWRQGGRTVLAWRDWLLALALVSLGVGVMVGALLSAASPSAAGSVAALVIVWIGMLVPVVWAFTRSRPAGLLRFRAIDLLWGVGLAFVLRLAQGRLTVALGGSAALPSYPLVDGGLSPEWWFTEALGAIIISPVLEEFFFRAVLIVALFTILRRSMGRPVAGLVAVLVSTLAFVLVHVVDGGGAVDQLVATGILGLVCGALVVLTGRIWGAVLVHVLYGLSFVALALAGTFLG
ncbi:CPBP family intramembrane glutamic endopeptidase [Microbacterium rhizomatis]|uniref:CPBP family intramembrane metalloprotease n=1 Tax=Microbacterium rhizomatis TaxID=1631477 RepID=A0A5J5J0D2_9MICO|nr:type II CAAX endopeptidase family protein [Microbacterium rhizomatis]KAA9107787.1 CPBP family intramembrane metalloprotease [Microbacterium rhizomatis]